MSRHRDDDLAPIALRDARLKSNPAGRPWSWRLHLFVRAVAVAEFAKGLFHWATLMGVGSGGQPFAGDPTAWKVATVVFAVADLVAAVGLWLGAAWGVVMWLLAALGQIVFGMVAPGVVGSQWLVSAIEVAAMAVYLGLSLKARREER